MKNENEKCEMKLTMKYFDEYLCRSQSHTAIVIREEGKFGRYGPVAQCATTKVT